jgi:FkbM family methyltransferase
MDEQSYTPERSCDLSHLSRYVRRLKWLTYRHLLPCRSIVTFDHSLGSRLRLEFSDVSAPHIYFGTYEREETSLIRELVRPGMTVLDIGANIGYFTLLIASKLGPHGTVHAFEPNPAMLTRLKENIALNPEYNDGRVVFHQVALGANTGEANFFCPVLGHEGVGGLRNTGRAPLSHILRLPVQTLDLFLESEGIGKLDLIKLDVEGGELDVMRGGERTLAAFRPMILFEACELNTLAYGYRVFELLSYLEQRNYVVTQAGLGQNFLATPKGCA